MCVAETGDERASGVLIEFRERERETNGARQRPEEEEEEERGVKQGPTNRREREYSKVSLRGQSEQESERASAEGPILIPNPALQTDRQRRDSFVRKSPRDVRKRGEEEERIGGKGTDGRETE